MPKENVLIMAVKSREQKSNLFQSSLDELKSLCETAGGIVCKVITQNRQQIHPATYIGEGKISEIKQEIINYNIELIVSNDELSPGQIRNLSDYFNIRIIDRSQLILDIFAQRAKTKEGQLQVELAQLEYLLPRLRGQGTMLSRLGGGIGTRGPGETKLETDQRYIRQRITDIKRRLKLVVQQRTQYRRRRKANDVFQIAIVGYTNAGKSTLFNNLTNTESLAEDKLFATLDPLTRKIKLPTGFEVLITDTVGFLQKLPTSLIAAFKSTLEEVTEADFLLHVVDVSNENEVQQQETVMEILKQLGADTIPMLTVYNKKDLLQETFIPLNHPYMFLSAFNEDDLLHLLFKIEELLKEKWEMYYLLLNPDEGKMIQRLKSETIVTEKFYLEDKNQYMIKGYMPNNHPLQFLLKEKNDFND